MDDGSIIKLLLVWISVIVLALYMANKIDSYQKEITALKQCVEHQADLNKLLSDQMVKCETRYLTRCKCPEEE